MIGLLKLERIYTKPFDLSGKRILVDRLWTRGISKADANLDMWAKSIASSVELREWLKHENNKYPEFKQRYINELEQNPAMDDFMMTIKDLAVQSDVIILYGTKNTHHNNAVMLAEYLSEQLKLPVADDNHFINFYYNDGESNTGKQLPNDLAWFQHCPDVRRQLGIKLDEQHHHITYLGQNLEHADLFELAKSKLNYLLKMATYLNGGCFFRIQMIN